MIFFQSCLAPIAFGFFSSCCVTELITNYSSGKLMTHNGQEVFAQLLREGLPETLLNIHNSLKKMTSFYRGEGTMCLHEEM